MRLNSKGQVTIPREVRRRLGVRAGDRLLFEEEGDAVRVTAVRKESPFAKYAGSGIPELVKGERLSRSGCGICAANRRPDDDRNRYKRTGGALGRRNYSPRASPASAGEGLCAGKPGDCRRGVRRVVGGTGADGEVFGPILRRDQE